ncbi:MAG: DUF1499 domain-containing protein [Hyphomicrobiaceae bacterium]|nr:DUF1499 domain-containing protein [Hyphomicrobiaceae bacterium]
MQDEPRATAGSVWCRRLAMFAVGLILAGAVFHRLFGMPTPVALNLFALGLVLAVTATVSGVFGLFRIWRTGMPGTASALFGLIVSGLILCWPLSLLPRLNALPNINDVTTDTARPPRFVELARQRPKGANPARYPGAAVAKLQSAFYREIQPLFINRAAPEAFELATLALRRLRMVIVHEVPVGSEVRTEGLIEAYDRTLALGFYDDVAVRVTAIGRSSRIDVRSASRFGRHDLGRNARRIRDILNEIVARVDATIPGQQTRKSKKPDAEDDDEEDKPTRRRRKRR